MKKQERQKEAKLLREHDNVMKQLSEKSKNSTTTDIERQRLHRVKEEEQHVKQQNELKKREQREKEELERLHERMKSIDIKSKDIIINLNYHDTNFGI